MAKEGTEVSVSKGTLERVTPARRFDDAVRTMDAFFNRSWPRPLEWARWPGAMGEASTLPSVDVIDRDDEVLVRAEVPGADEGRDAGAHAAQSGEVQASDHLDRLTIDGSTGSGIGDRARPAEASVRKTFAPSVTSCARRAGFGTSGAQSPPETSRSPCILGLRKSPRRPP
jgi:hypothetical protein